MDITTFVIGYLLISAVCTTVFVSACMVNGRIEATRKSKKRVVRVEHSGGTWRNVDSATHAR